MFDQTGGRSTPADLTADERSTLGEWFQKFKSKYPVVGVLRPGESASSIQSGGGIQ